LIEFPFIEFESESLGRILKQFALVTLINGKNRQEVVMLIDSGADVTLISKRRGKRLEFEPPQQDETKSLGGIAGSIPIVYRNLEIKIGGEIFSLKTAWAQVENVPSVLGRVDMFDKFDIEFKQKDKKVIFRKRE